MRTRNEISPPSIPTVRPIALTVTDAVALSGICRTQIFQFIKEGKLRTALIGRHRLVMMASLEELIEQHTV